MARLMYYGELRELVGLTGEQFDAATVPEALKLLADRHGSAARKAAKRSLVTLDGVRLDRLSGPLPSDSVLCFFPLCSGG